MKRTTRQKANDIWLSIQSSFPESRAKKGGETVTQNKKERILEHNKQKRQLTDEQVLEMKELYKNDISIGLPELAKKYGVGTGPIKFALEGTTYSDVGEPVVLRTPLLTCPHCDSPPMIKGNFTRFHGDECTLKGINVQHIIDDYNKGGTSFAKLGKKYGLSPSKVDNIVKNYSK